MLWVRYCNGITKVIAHYHSCKIPTNPAHGRWNCDVEKSGATVCLLECDKQFSITGSHIIECDLKQETFDPDPAQSLCAKTANTKFHRKILYYEFKSSQI